MDILPSFLQCPDSAGGGVACMGTSAIIRMSFVLAVFHFLVFTLILARNTAVAIFHDGCWLFKSLLVVGMFIGSLYIKNSFF